MTENIEKKLIQYLDKVYKYPSCILDNMLLGSTIMSGSMLVWVFMWLLREWKEMNPLVHIVHVNNISSLGWLSLICLKYVETINFQNISEVLFS